LPEKHVALGIAPLRHEGLQPIELQVVLRRVADIGDEPQHLPQSVRVQRQKDGMKDQDRIDAANAAIDDEDAVARDRHDPQRDHRPH
jgi:hypothetical protein